MIPADRMRQAIATHPMLPSAHLTASPPRVALNCRVTIVTDTETTVTNVRALSKHRGSSLNRRREIAVELPEFAIRAIEWRVEEGQCS